MSNLYIWISLILSDTTAQLLLKKGTLENDLSFGISPLILAGYSLYIVSFFLWMQILKTTPLYVALSCASLIFITIALGAHFFLGESLTIKSLVGTIFVAIGVYIISYSREKS